MQVLRVRMGHQAKNDISGLTEKKTTGLRTCDCKDGKAEKEKSKFFNFNTSLFSNILSSRKSVCA